MHLIFDCTIAGYNIRLEQRNNGRFKVIYGLQINEDLSYEQASLELGSAILHAKTCTGLVD